ncbi:MAG TPA: nucleotidyltransferase family protein [Ilumatobacter sp.]|nr:nucleotidyltransferase family protein [Ilumatobacter sp.]
MIDRAVILAAGRGTRLGTLTAHRPKPLIEVGGRALLLRIIDGLVDAGLSDVTVITGYLAEMVESAVRGERYPVEIEFRRQMVFNGTAAAVALARDRLADSPFFFAWGDILVDDTNYASVIDAAGDGDGSLAVNAVDDPWAGAAVEIDATGFVTRIVEKPPPGTSRTPYNNSGFGVLPYEIWTHVDSLQTSPRGELELPRAIASLVEAGARLRAFTVTGPWWDIGTPDDLTAARAAYDATYGG